MKTPITPGIEVANDVDYGLSAGIVTNDHIEAEEFVIEVKTRAVKTDKKTTSLELRVPFGGYKQTSSET